MIVAPRGRENAQKPRASTARSARGSGAAVLASARRCDLRAMAASATAANSGAAQAPTTDPVVPSTAIAAPTSTSRQVGMNRFCTTV